MSSAWWCVHILYLVYILYLACYTIAPVTQHKQVAAGLDEQCVVVWLCKADGLIG